MRKSTAKPSDPPGTLNEKPPVITDVWAPQPSAQMEADMQKDAINRGEDPAGAEEL